MSSEAFLSVDTAQINRIFWGEGFPQFLRVRRSPQTKDLPICFLSVPTRMWGFREQRHA